MAATGHGASTRGHAISTARNAEATAGYGASTARHVTSTGGHAMSKPGHVTSTAMPHVPELRHARGVRFHDRAEAFHDSP
jgi:hypothetical protein